MRRGAFIFATTLLLGGCANHPAPTTQIVVEPAVTAVAASALVFDPPITAESGSLDLTRDDREPSSFAGYEQSSTTLSYIRIDDRQGAGSFWRGDGYERQAIVVQSSIRYR
jgi:hypothetical protein